VLELNADSPDGVRRAGSAGGPADLLDGDWVNGADTYPSGDGTPGGDFNFRVNILTGDVNRSGTVLADDASAVKRRFFSRALAPGTGESAYSIYHDVNGDGVILADDFSQVKLWFFSRLPPAPADLQGGSGWPFGTTRVAREVLGA
jgi:hypothetical protein